MIKPIIVMTVAALRGERRASAERLIAELEPQCRAEGVELFVHHDYSGQGSLEPWLHCLRHAVTTEATHVTYLPDDVFLVPHFVEVLIKVIEAKPEALICCLSNHEAARAAYERGARWYTTSDGYVAFAGTMPTYKAREYLAWRNGQDLDNYPADASVNLWAITTRRLIHKPLPSLVQHDLSLESLEGNQWQNSDPRANTLRTSQVWEPEADLREVDWSGETLAVSPTFNCQRWDVAFNLPPTESNLEAMYEAHRGGPISAKPHVLIAMPSSRNPELAVRKSVEYVLADLHAHGYGATWFETGGDSLVTRGRHALCHEFLCSGATHLLQWDDDVECLDPTSVRKMLESGFDVVGGAYPWRDGSGRVVANPLRESVLDGAVDVDTRSKCIRVAEVGTGFMLVSRKCLVDLCVKHPELKYQADIEPYVGCPMWALFDAHIERRPSGRARYASEDWRFCQLAREAGYDVAVYYPPIFRHWGKTAHEGHILNAWGMNKPAPVKEAAE